MSTESIFQKELFFNEPYYGNATPFGYVESTEIAKLISSFEDDKPLRSLFIKNVFKDLPRKKLNGQEETDEDYQNLVDFIRTSQIIPCCIPNKPPEYTYKFFTRLTQTADKFFLEKISRKFEDICKKAEEIGIIKPELYIDSVKHKGKSFHRISFPGMEELFVMDTPAIFTFYKISESLFELWVKPENVGMFLEIWVYHTLKSFFTNNKDVSIYHRVIIYRKEKRIESVKDLVRGKRSFPLTDVDVSLFKNNTSICGVECKHDADFSDVLKFYGVLKLLNIPKGIFVSVNNFANDKINYRQFENIHIFTNVTENNEFTMKIKEVVADIYNNN